MNHENDDLPPDDYEPEAPFNSDTNADSDYADDDDIATVADAADTADTSGIVDCGDYFTAPNVPGRIFKSISGHALTIAEVKTLLNGGEITITDGKTRDGRPFRTAPTARWDADAKPYPKVVLTFADAPARSPAKGDTGVNLGTDGGAITDEGDFYTVAEIKNERGWPVRFYKQVAGRDITPAELAEILKSKEAGFQLDGFNSKKTGRTFSARLWFNSKKQPWPGLDFIFDDRRS